MLRPRPIDPKGVAAILLSCRRFGSELLPLHNQAADHIYLAVTPGFG